MEECWASVVRPGLTWADITDFLFNISNLNTLAQSTVLAVINILYTDTFSKIYGGVIDTK